MPVESAWKSLNGSGRRRHSTNASPSVHVREATGFLLFLERLPEAESLIAGTGDNDLAVGAHGEIEHTIRVARERDNLAHAGILPDDDLVLAVAVRRDNLIAVARPGQVADLATRIQAAEKVRRSHGRNRRAARARCRSGCG